MGCIVNGPGESRAADIGISLPGTGEEPRAPVYVDGEKVVHARGPDPRGGLHGDGRALRRAPLRPRLTALVASPPDERREHPRRWTMAAAPRGASWRLTGRFWPTLRDAPAGAEAVSHKLMVRAGLVRQLAAGIYVYPAGRLARHAEDRADHPRGDGRASAARRCSCRSCSRRRSGRQSGRWDAIGSEMFRLKDRKGRDMALAMTHEEVVTWLAAREIHSYKQLPQMLVPLPDQGARRGAAQERHPAHARVHHEGLVQARRERGGPAGELPGPRVAPTTASSSAAALRLVRWSRATRA